MQTFLVHGLRRPLGRSCRRCGSGFCTRLGSLHIRVERHSLDRVPGRRQAECLVGCKPGDDERTHQSGGEHPPAERAAAPVMPVTHPDPPALGVLVQHPTLGLPSSEDLDGWHGGGGIVPYLSRTRRHPLPKRRNPDSDRCLPTRRAGNGTSKQAGRPMQPTIRDTAPHSTRGRLWLQQRLAPFDKT